MNWKQLLSQKRTKELLGKGIPSTNFETEFRTEFQRDYDRCLFSTPVRRLQDKAQVFPLEPNDSVRTRLTHSLEVSQIARGIADLISVDLLKNDKINQDQRESIILIAETAALIHDLGNPPFGHSGEDAMRLWFKKKIEDGKRKILSEKENFEIGELTKELEKDLLNFEGNAQTIRLVSKLQMLGDFNGLNLTSGTLSASRKYIADSLSIGNQGQGFKKLGYFQSEKDLIDKVENETGTENKRNPITLMVEAADDIAYSIIDLEDGIKKGVLNWVTLAQRMGKAGDFGSKLIKKAEDNINSRCAAENFTQLNKDDLLEGFKELKGKALDEARISILRTFFISDAVESVSKTFLDHYSDIMKGDFDKELVEICTMREEISVAKSMAVEFIFPHHSILKLELMGKKIIHDLMDMFWQGIVFAPYLNKDYKKQNKLNLKTYDLLSSNYKAIFENGIKNSKVDGKIETNAFYFRCQLLADYICGMTDNFAVVLHKELHNGN